MPETQWELINAEDFHIIFSLGPPRCPDNLFISDSGNDLRIVLYKFSDFTELAELMNTLNDCITCKGLGHLDQDET